MSGRDGDHDEVVDSLRADMERSRLDIDRTVAELAARLEPDRLRSVFVDRMREMTGPWQERPREQIDALSRETMTRIREMAWINPLGLGLAAAAVGFWMGRRGRSGEPGQ